MDLESDPPKHPKDEPLDPEEPLEPEEEQPGEPEDFNPPSPEDDNEEEARRLKKLNQQQKSFAHKLKKNNAAAVQNVEEAMKDLLKQAEYYAKYLLSHHESAKKNKNKQQGEGTTRNSKRRGHFDEQELEEKQIMEEQQDEANAGVMETTHLEKQPSILAGGQLKFYQMVGLNWLISLYESGINGILADDMGLGKTIQTISILGFLRQYKKINGPHIIIAPKITLGNWVREIGKWLPMARVVKLIATKEERQKILDTYISKGKFDIVVTSFEGVRICLKWLRRIKWKYLVIDEAHKIKNEESMLSQVVRSLNTNFKLLLTGTPLQNNLHELWSLLNFILPDIFDSSELFDTWFNVNSSTTDSQESKEELEKKNLEMVQRLHKILRPFMLRRTKKQVQKTLPGKKQVHVFVGLTETQVKIYKNLLQNRNCGDDEKKFYLNLLMQLRKICNHPYLFEGIEEEGAPALGEHIISASGKMIVLDQLLKKLFDEKHQVLIFSQMTMVLDILEDYCNYRGFKYCRIDGSTDMESRDNQINDFTAEGSEKFIFLLSTRAGGLGINLTSADTVIIYDSDWNPQMDLQAMDRAHRIGQKNMVNVYRLITEHTLEEKMIQRQTVKLRWDSLVIQQGGMTSQKNRILSRDQMKEMMQHGSSIIFKAEKGTLSQEKIEELLERGETRTNQLNQEVDKKLKEKASGLDLGMSSINIFDFLGADETNKEDAEALDEAVARTLEADIHRARRNASKIIIDPNSKNQISKTDKQRVSKKIVLTEHHFYKDKNLLTDLLQKEEDYNTFKSYDSTYKPLTEEQQQKKTELLATGFTNWSKQDYYNFITASQKYGQSNYEDIAKHVNKTVQQVTEYANVFWSRLDELSEKDKIKKQMQQGEERLSQRKHYGELLMWKSQQGYEVDFNHTIYTKFRSKLFTIEADKFLVSQLQKLGINNMALVRQKIRTESMFRFDHFFRSRTESELNKRMLSLYKLIEKEKDASNGIGIEPTKELTKKEKKALKMRLKGIQEEDDESVEQVPISLKEPTVKQAPKKQVKNSSQPTAANNITVQNSNPFSVGVTSINQNNTVQPHTNPGTTKNEAPKMVNPVNSTGPQYIAQHIAAAANPVLMNLARTANLPQNLNSAAGINMAQAATLINQALGNNGYTNLFNPANFQQLLLSSANQMYLSNGNAMLNPFNATIANGYTMQQHQMQQQFSQQQQQMHLQQQQNNINSARPAQQSGQQPNNGVSKKVNEVIEIDEEEN